jgi:hypothetical protein
MMEYQRRRCGISDWSGLMPAATAIRGRGPIRGNRYSISGARYSRGRFLECLIPCVPDGSERLTAVSRLLDEGEDVGDALVGIDGGNMVGIAPQNHQPRIGNEGLVLPRLLDRLHFASVGRHH